MNRQLLRGLAFLVSLGFVGTLHGQFRTVALSESPTGTMSEEFFERFFAPTINDAGRVSFQAWLQNSSNGLGFGNETGIWSDSTGKLELVARSNVGLGADPSFYLNGGPDDLQLNNGGSSVFPACTEAFRQNGGIACGGQGVASWENGQLNSIIDDSTPLPGANGSLSFREEYLDADRNGQVYIKARLDQRSGAWTTGPDGTRLIALEGESVPVPAGFASSQLDSVFSFVPFGNRRLVNTHGAAVFSGEVDSTGGLWLVDDVNRLVAYEGQVLDGTNGLQIARQGISPFDTIHLTDNNEVIFYTEFTRNDDVGFENDEAIISADGEDFRIVAREGDSAPGGGEFRTLGFANDGFAANKKGDVVFEALLAESDDLFGVWVDRGNGLENLYRARFSAASGVAINENQQVAFHLQGSIVGENIAGELIDVVKSGDVLEVAPGDFRTVNFVGFEGNRGLNDAGQVAFTAIFADGSRGVFVSDALLVPEPSGWLLGLMFLLSYAMRYRRPTI